MERAGFPCIHIHTLSRNIVVSESAHIDAWVQSS